MNSFFDNVASVTRAASSNFNSQTVPLLQPAVNIDPNPAKGGGNINIVGGMALASDMGPSGTIGESAVPVSTQISVYTVHPGDTLSEIAQMFDVTVKTIVWANDIQNGKINPGQVLVILPITGIRHTVEKGETLASIAKKYKGDADEIAQYNDLSGGKLAVGDVVIIPDGEIVSAPVTVKAKTSVSVTSPLRNAGGPHIDSYYTWPVNGGVVTQGLHGYDAVDIGAPSGTSIFASAGGVVIVARDSGWNGGYGNYVVIQHNNGTQTLYAHMSSVIASVGDVVTMGQTIGRVGMTGKATGNHLHFEVRGAANPFAN